MGPAIVTRPLLLAALFSAFGFAAMAESGRFAASLAGIKAGTLTYTGTEEAGRYSVQGSVRAGGLAGAFFDFAMNAAAQGRVSGNDYHPKRYDLRGHEGGEDRAVGFRYRNGVPQITPPPIGSRPAHAADPAGQGGTLDPMTVIYAMLRDRPKELMCQLDADFFDGRRRANVRYVKMTPLKGGKYLCEGQYRRLLGFSHKELREKPFWPISVYYAPLSDGSYRVTEMRFHTNFGSLRLGRR